jgi:outer membrane protein OmpA-like peptidoglycan-associated protein
VVATVKVTNNTTGILEQNVHATGTYEITLTVGHDYGLAIKADGFLFKSERIDLREVREAQNIEQKVEVDKIEIGVQSTLRNTFYRTGASDLSPESTAELQNLIIHLNQKPTLRLEISGHTDNTGSDAINNRLSQARAKAVVDYLVQHGIAANRLTYVGYGSSKPVADNRTEAGRAINRRTEIKIIGT